MAIINDIKEMTSNKLSSVLEPGMRKNYNGLDDDGLVYILNAQHQWSKKASKYYDYYIDKHDLKSRRMFELSKSANDYGILNNDLPFFDEHLKSTFVTTLFNNKTAKILSELKQNDEEYKADEFIQDFTYNYLAIGNFYVFNSILESGEEEQSILEWYRVEKTTEGHNVITSIKKGIYEVIKYDKDTYVANRYIYNQNEREEKQWQHQEEVKLDKYPLVEIKRRKNDIANIKDSLLSISQVESLMVEESVSLQNTLHADEQYFKNSKFTKKKKYRIYSGTDNVSGTRPLFEFVNEQLKDSSYINILEYEKKNVSNEMGLSLLFLGIDKTNDVTATESKITDSESINRINKDKQEIQKVFNDMMLMFNASWKEVIFTLSKVDEQVERANYVNSIYQLVSVRERVTALFPTKTEEEINKEVVRIKTEQGIPFTSEEESYISQVYAVEESFNESE